MLGIRSLELRAYGESHIDRHTVCGAHMRNYYIALLACVAVLLAIGQTLFRIGAQQAEPVTDLSSAIWLMLNPVVIAALTLYGGTTVLYIYILQNVPLSSAYPFMALSFILVPLAAVLFLGETVGLNYVVGMALVIAGLFVTTL
ncbi:EamA family transporter [Bradyrhizobium sp. USDA 4502]